MSGYSTRQAAQKLGIGFSTLRKYVDEGLIPVPPITYVGGVKVRLWTDQDIERLRDLLPKLPDGRKTRHKKKQLAVGNQQSAKSRSPKAAAPKAKTKKRHMRSALAPNRSYRS